MAEIIVVRHGQASFGTDNYDQLSELGYRQAAVLGEYCMKNNVQFDTVYSGTLARQIQTANTVLKAYENSGLKVPVLIQDERLNELDVEQQVEVLAPHVVAANQQFAPLLDNAFSDKKAFQKLIRATFDFWIEHPELGDQLESWMDVEDRISKVMQRVHTENGSGTTAGVFTSGGVIAVVVAQLLRLPSRGVYPLFEKVINASLTRILTNSNTMSLSTFNEYSYLNALSDDKSIISYR